MATIVIGQALAPAALAAPDADPQTPTQLASAVHTQVLVYGGTPAGIMAALAAKRSGAASVALVETTGHLGGMMSSGLTATDWGDQATIGGITREFFNRMQAIEGSAHGRYNFQSKNAEAVFNTMLADSGVWLFRTARLVETPDAVTRDGTRIIAITLTSGDVLSADVFIDASYEGDLMARAGTSYVVGREAASQYGEEFAGVRVGAVVVWGAGDIEPGFPVVAPGPLGSADGHIQASNFRICLSSNRANQVPFRQPGGYDPATYDIVAKYLNDRVAGGESPRLEWVLWSNPIVNAKFDVNDFGAMSSGVPGANYTYPDGTYEERAQIVAWHRAYTEGLLYFLRNDSRVPGPIRDRMAMLGLCADEFTDNGNWPYLLYLREGRRLVGTSVLTSHDIQTIRSKPDIIAIGSYIMDAHIVSRYLDAAGNLLVEGWFSSPRRVSYAIPYSIMLPARAQLTNLLVPVTSSASHVAQSSLRMEPQYMMMGEAAGTAATLAAAGGQAVQDVSVTVLQSRLRAAGSNLNDPGDFGTSPFYADIVWAYASGITASCGDGRFCPTGTVTREQMASFLVRAMALPPAPRDFFIDDGGSVHQDDINRLAASGITTGCTATTFCPTAGVSREQMASFLVRGFGLPAAPRDSFTDDTSSIHQSDINRLAASGITTGCSPTTFCPRSVVTRGEMVAFLHRAMT
jgi:hypothetical protein